MKQTKYFCDFCKKEIPIQDVRHDVYFVYDDDYGEDLRYDCEFCSQSCREMFNKRREEEKGK